MKKYWNLWRPDNANDEQVLKTRDNADDANKVSNDDHEHDNSVLANQQEFNKTNANETANMDTEQQDKGTVVVDDQDKCEGIITVPMNVKDFVKEYLSLQIFSEAIFCNLKDSLW